MKKTRIAKMLTAAALSAAMVMTMGGMTAFAAAPTTNAVGTYTFKKTLIVPEEANVPDAEFSFTVTGTDEKGESDNRDIKKGVGTLTFENVEFDTSDAKTPKMGDDGETVEYYYAQENLVLTIPAGTYTQPGIYRYVISESTGTNVLVKDDITNDTNKYMDVRVVNENGTLTIDDVKLFNSVDAISAKADGFTNTYNTYNLTLTKHVTGDMGETNVPFTFTVEFTGPVGTTFQLGGTGEFGSNNTVTLTGDTGSATGTAIFRESVLLEADETFEVSGIPSCVTYTITEKTPGNSYKTNNVVNGNWENLTFESNVETTGRKTMGAVNNTVDFVNRRDSNEGIPATGIILNFAPYILLVAFAGVFAVLFLRKRREEF